MNRLMGKGALEARIKQLDSQLEEAHYQVERIIEEQVKLVMMLEILNATEDTNDAE